MTLQQLSLNFQTKQNTKNPNYNPAAEKHTKHTKQPSNTTNSYKLTNLEKIKSLNYILTPEKHITEKPNNPENNSKDELEKIIEELKRAEEERKKIEKILRETINEILPKSINYRT